MDGRVEAYSGWKMQHSAPSKRPSLPLILINGNRECPALPSVKTDGKRNSPELPITEAVGSAGDFFFEGDGLCVAVSLNRRQKKLSLVAE